MVKSVYDEMIENEHGINERLKQSYNKRDEGGKFKSYLVNLPYPIWRRANITHTLDILPWRAGKNYPGQAEGSLQYVLILWVHKKIGYQQNNYICTQMNYNEPCAICDKIEKITQMDGYDEEFVKSISPKKRCAYYVLVWDTKQDERKGVQIWESSHWHSEKEIVMAAREGNSGELFNFCHPINGKALRFDGEGRGIEAARVDLIDRIDPADRTTYEIPRDIIDKLPSLDNFIEILSYDEMSKITIGSAKSKGDYDANSGRDERRSRDGNEDNRSRFTTTRSNNSSNRSNNDRSDRFSNRNDSDHVGSSGRSVRRAASSDNRGSDSSNDNVSRGSRSGNQRQLQNSGGRSQLSSRRPGNARIDREANPKDGGRNKSQSVRDEEKYVDDQYYGQDLNEDDIPY